MLDLPEKNITMTTETKALSGMLAFLMPVTASVLRARSWTPVGMQIAFSIVDLALVASAVL